MVQAFISFPYKMTNLLDSITSEAKELVVRRKHLTMCRAFKALAESIGLYDDKPTLRDDAQTDFILSHQQ